MARANESKCLPWEAEVLSHVNEEGRPVMVDVGRKTVSRREAQAKALVVFPPEVFSQLETGSGSGSWMSPKGSVLGTATIAGIQAVKKTSDLIPLCHPLPLDGIDVVCRPIAGSTVEILCTVKTTHKTGVEMEALTGASVAALTIYDMTKALSHAIVIKSVSLVAKTGGKSDYRQQAAPMYGLVLTGGRSSRMGSDKAELDYSGQPELDRVFELLSHHCEKVFVSCRQDQSQTAARAKYPQIWDLDGLDGPLAGIEAALKAHPDCAWLVVACDLPYVNEATLKTLVSGRKPTKQATAFRGFQDLPEPLCAIWEPSSAEGIADFVASGRDCPRKYLLGQSVEILAPPRPQELTNANDPPTREAILRDLRS